MALAQPDLQPRRAPSTMKKFASSRSLNKILAQCDSSSREYEEIQAVERRWHLHLATPRCLLLDRRSKASLFFAAPPPPKRAPSTTLTLRSKSMTAELEELGERRGRWGADSPGWGAGWGSRPNSVRDRREDGRTDGCMDRSEVNAWVLEWSGNWAEEGGGVWLDWALRGGWQGWRRTVGCPGLGYGGRAWPPACLPACARAAPGAHASSVTLLLHFIRVRRGALSFAPGTNCAVCASLTLLAPTYASAKQGNYSELLTSGLREHCWYTDGTGPQEWLEAKKSVLGLGWTCGGHSPRMATSSLIIGVFRYT